MNAVAVMDIDRRSMPASINGGVWKITPTLAKEWMSSVRPQNRTIIPANVAFLAEAMISGAWRVNGEPIILNDHGQVIDGQHRLLAVIKSGVSIESMVVSGVHDDAFNTIDTGRTRAGRDVLSAMGMKNAAHIATAAAMLWRVERSGGFSPYKTMRPSNDQIVQVVKAHPGIGDSVKKVAKAKGLIGIGTAACLHYVFSRSDPAMADVFFDALAVGANLREGQPVHLLRRRLEDDRGKVAAKLQEHVKIALVIKAWNAERAGQREMKVLRFKPDEDYPQPQ